MELIDISVKLTSRDLKTLLEMAEDHNDSISVVMRQALRTYQLIQTGHSKLVEINPLPSKTKCPDIFLGEELSPEELDLMEAWEDIK